MSVASIMTLVGVAAPAPGLALVAVGVPVVWLAWSGAVLTLGQKLVNHKPVEQQKP